MRPGRERLDWRRRTLTSASSPMNCVVGGLMSVRSGFLFAAVLLSAAPAGTLADQEQPHLPPGGDVEQVITSDLSKVEPIIDEVLVEAPLPRYVAPTLPDSIGRIWAPVFINGKGPVPLVLDTGATRSALLPRVARALQIPLEASTMRVHGVTGSSDVSTVAIQQMEVGDLLMKSTTLPIVADVFGGADGVLGNEALGDKRI